MVLYAFPTCFVLTSFHTKLNSAFADPRPGTRLERTTGVSEQWRGEGGTGGLHWCAPRPQERIGWSRDGFVRLTSTGLHFTHSGLHTEEAKMALCDRPFFDFISWFFEPMFYIPEISWAFSRIRNRIHAALLESFVPCTPKFSKLL